MVNIKKAIPYVAILLVLTVSIILFRSMGSGARTNQPGARQDTANHAITVQVQQARNTQLSQARTYDATLEPSEEGIIGAAIPGKVVQIMFKEGNWVAQGTPLVKLDSQDTIDQLEAAQAQLNAVEAGLPKAEANLSTLQRNYNNAKSLYDAGAVSENDLNNAETALKAGQADLGALNANIQVAEQGVNRLQHLLENMVLKAPISGIVEEKNVEVGQYAAPGMPLAKVKNTSILAAVIQIPQDDIGRIKIGQKAQVRLIGTKSVYDGTVSYIGATANAASRTLQCKVEVSNKDHLLKPGIYAQVDIDGSKVSALAIPLKAVAGSEGSYYVFTNKNGVAQRKDVVLGETYKDLIEIKSGLTGGESVICTNINSLQDGDRILTAKNRGE